MNGAEYLAATLSHTIQKQRDAAFAKSPQLSIGQLLRELNKCQKEIEGEDKNPPVIFDFEYIAPAGIDSWRGSYSELALSYHPEGQMFLEDLIAMLEAAIGHIFTGWKGGDYLMNKDTPIWVANPGNSGNTGVVGVLNKHWQIVILTAYTEYIDA